MSSMTTYLADNNKGYAPAIADISRGGGGALSGALIKKK